MSVSGRYELFSLAVSVLLSLQTGIFYDLARSFGKAANRRQLFDLVFFAAEIPANFLLWLTLLNGEVRWYIIAGWILGLFIYFMTLSGAFFRIFLFFAGKICDFFHIFSKKLLTLWCFLGKMIICIKNKMVGIKNEKIKHEI